MTDAVEVRPITEPEFADWQRALKTGFLQHPTLTADQLDARRKQFVPGRLLGAFDGPRCVATFRSFAQELTAVGGATLPADAVSNVTVTPTHRRRGLLTRMMSQDLAAAKERGDVVATLIAAEYRIYGRYGFGPATTLTEWTIDVSRTGLDPRWSRPEGGGRIDLVDGEDIRKLGPELHERVRRSTPGAVSLPELSWQLRTGAVRFDSEWAEPYFAVYRSATGEVEGIASYDSDDNWHDKQPHNTADVRWLLAATPAAERALWHYLCSIDWITKVKSGWRSPDDLLPHHLPDPRAARITTQADWLWVRILDVVRALEARTYDRAGSLVLDVVDRQGLAGGRFRLDASPEGASCTPTTDTPELTLDIAELASVWLGDQSVTRLHALGRVREERVGAVREADALLRASGRPWCPDIF
ncbi:putative acetyltransferase [Streptomyces sp. Ag109_O5-1]|uniref:GNAT family N-acetyltransferase n=1 Tax=Streptomyces sp. Ag109_O5-1 TaxID=1938851 RepID=UPI000F4DC34A|nr:GNAT family N-acetyltransferase [Streptomyces sp. Ag109_O5-1]RPE42799.1 putative acetyltransferase [Streptomyces sp. Ag109_O5-1]